MEYYYIVDAGVCPMQTWRVKTTKMLEIGALHSLTQDQVFAMRESGVFERVLQHELLSFPMAGVYIYNNSDSYNKLMWCQ